MGIYKTTANIWVCLKIVYPIVPNGFADHYPYEKWLFHWENKPYFQTNPNHGENDHFPHIPVDVIITVRSLGHEYWGAMTLHIFSGQSPLEIVQTSH